jgi:hypothetical protein
MLLTAMLLLSSVALVGDVLWMVRLLLVTVFFGIVVFLVGSVDTLMEMKECWFDVYGL